MRVRGAAVAGLFYADDPSALGRDLDVLLDQARPGRSGRPPRALIVPHAGYAYSGSVAARAYRLLDGGRQRIRRVAAFGPAHRVPLTGMAVPSADAFETPLGKVPLDRAAIQRIASLPGVTIADEPHRLEHCLEVQLPFLQRRLGDFTLIPVVVGDAPPAQVAAVVDDLAQIPGTLFLISSDLSHFLDDRHARDSDRRTRDKILARRPTITGMEACGASALNGFLSSRLATRLSVELVDMANSGDVTGDRDRVVGYGSFVLR